MNPGQKLSNWVDTIGKKCHVVPHLGTFLWDTVDTLQWMHSNNGQWHIFLQINWNGQYKCEYYSGLITHPNCIDQY